MARRSAPRRVPARTRSNRERSTRFRFDPRGTRFRIYQQASSVKGFAAPLTVYVASRPGTIGPGPADSRIRVIDADGRRPYKWKLPYSDSAAGEPRWRPPYPPGDPRHPPLKARRGHFDHVRVGTRAFSAANAFATVRCVLEIWEHYLGRRIVWFFRDRQRQHLELIPRVETNNAWSGEGFLEFGYFLPRRRGRRRRDPAWLSENFDVVAHETGHLILKSVIGNPTAAKKTLEYRAHEEGAADLVALIACLHFDRVVARLLANTRGRLFSRNMLSRFGEESRGGQIRSAFNSATIWSPSITAAEEQYEPHAFSRLFTGGAFDVLVEIYEQYLVRRGAIPAGLARESKSANAVAIDRASPPVTHRRFQQLRRSFTVHYAKNPDEFRLALLDARDDFGRLLAKTWARTSVEDFPGRDRPRGNERLPFAGVVANMIAADRTLGGRYGTIIRAAFHRRGISPATGRR
jgi:hypothetical protein